MANEKLESLFGHIIHSRETPRAITREPITLSGEENLDRRMSTLVEERSRTRRAREKAILWLLKRLGYNRKDTTQGRGKGAGFRRYNAIIWKKGGNDNRTKARENGDRLEKEDHNDKMSEEDSSDRLTQISNPREMFDDFDREPYIGRRTSIGSVERNDATLLFDILDDLKDFEDRGKTKVNLGRLQRHLLAMCGDST